MYYVRRNNKFLFLMFDIITIVLSYYLAGMDSMIEKYSLHTCLILVVIGIVVALFSEEYWTISDRGYIQEMKSSFLYVLKVVTLFSFVMLVINIVELELIARKLLLLTLLLIFTIYLERTLAKRINLKYMNDRRDIIVLSDFSEVDNIENQLPNNYNIVAYINEGYETEMFRDKKVLRSKDEIRYFLARHRVDELYANINHDERFSDILKIFEVIGITTKINISPIFNGFDNNTIVTFQGDNIYLTSALKIATLRQLILKRTMDIVVALVGLVLMLIVAIIIYPIVRKQAPGPLIFTQNRVGVNGKRFKIYKFRSMYVDAEERKKELMEQNDLNTTLMFKMEDDPRIFPFGHKMRAWSIDELPQFINVLKGDMSVVGTRPPTVDEYRNYELHHFKRLAVKPGITGMWQVGGRSDIKDFEQVVGLDMKYIENWSLRLDIKIIVKTIGVVLKREGSR